MKKCTYCGKEYPDDVTACPQDGNSVVPSPPVASPMTNPVPSNPSSGLAITSMVLGILSLILCVIGPLLGIPAVACGHTALSRAKRMPLQYGGQGFAITGLVTGYIGIAFLLLIPILAGLLLPALAKAKEKALQINCASNLKQVSLAARIWSGDHDDVLPATFMQMTNELTNPRILVCPADPNHKLPASGTPMIWDPNNITYEFLTPGMKEADITNQVVFRCPIHGTEVLGNGSVRFKTKTRPRSD
jgi:hypothetical protein